MTTDPFVEENNKQRAVKQTCNGSNRSSIVLQRRATEPQLNRSLHRDKSRSRSRDEASCSKPDENGITDVAVSFSPEMGDWRLLELDLVTYEIEQSRRTRLLRDSRRRYREISEPETTCCFL